MTPSASSLCIFALAARKLCEVSFLHFTLGFLPHLLLFSSEVLRLLIFSVSGAVGACSTNLPGSSTEMHGVWLTK